MDLYTTVAYGVSKLVTERYSTSFSMSTRLFSSSIRPEIYAIYGLVRIADEIVDTYRGSDAAFLLSQLEQSTYAAIERGYDANPVIHSFALTAKQYGINEVVLQPFFESMAMDLEPAAYNDSLYERYIYGSAEVVGLMCLKVFCGGDDDKYEQLKPGARALGAAYQKVNFLRDIAADYKELGRLYFPGVSFETFDDTVKMSIIADIEQEFVTAQAYIKQLPKNSQKAVTLSFLYYSHLLQELRRTPAAVLKDERVRVASIKKLFLLFFVVVGAKRA